jgi:hypothetical protein
LAVLTVVNYAHEILSSFSAYQDLHRTYPFPYTNRITETSPVGLPRSGTSLHFSGNRVSQDLAG